MRTTRRSMIGAALAAPLLPRFAKAAEFTLRLGHAAPVSFPLHIRISEAAEQIARESDGKVELQIFPDGQLGGDNDLLSQVRSGALDFSQPTGQIFAGTLPVTATPALGFAWSGYDKVWPAMDGELGAFIRKQITAKTGVVPMERIWDLGFRHITSSTKPIRTAEDLVGFKIRTPVAPSLVTLFKTLKAAPLAMQITELYSALQTHIADGQENPLALIQATKVYEVQKYCSLTAHVWDGHWWVCNGATWNGLPDPMKAIVAKAFNEGAVKERADIQAKDASVRGDLEAKGLIFNTADTAGFREGLRTGGFYKDWRQKLGEEAFGLLEKYAGTLG